MFVYFSPVCICVCTMYGLVRSEDLDMDMCIYSLYENFKKTHKVGGLQGKGPFSNIFCVSPLDIADNPMSSPW